MKKEIRDKIIKELASKWNNVQKRIESRQLDLERMNSEIQHDLEVIYEQEYRLAIRENFSEKEAHWKAREAVQEEENRIQEKEDRLHMEAEVIEEMLDSLGARMMRPYEHWNEDERYMEWAESRYDYDSGHEDFMYGDY